MTWLGKTSWEMLICENIPFPLVLGRWLCFAYRSSRVKASSVSWGTSLTSIRTTRRWQAQSYGRCTNTAFPWVQTPATYTWRKSKPHCLVLWLPPGVTRGAISKGFLFISRTDIKRWQFMELFPDIWLYLFNIQSSMCTDISVYNNVINVITSFQCCLENGRNAGLHG